MNSTDTAAALTTTDVLELCEQLLQRAGLTVAELAKHTGKHLPVVETPPPKEPGKLAPRVAETLEHLGRPQGATLAELEGLMGGISLKTAFIYVDQLIDLGLVTRVKVPGLRAARFFRDAAHAQQWANEQISLKTAFIYLDQLIDLGLVTRVKVPGLRAARFFRDAAHAQQWANEQITDALASRKDAAVRSPVTPTLSDIGQAVKSTAPLPTVRPPTALSKAGGAAQWTAAKDRRDDQ